jgi:prefoldin subunit 5
MKGHHQFTLDMKKILVLSMLVSLAMICSCQKKDSAAEQQLAQRKTELDAHEEALDERVNGLQERVNALDERVNALGEKQEATMNAPPNPTDVQGQISDPAQVQAARDAAIQQFSAEIRARIDDLEMKAQGDRKRQAGLEQLQGAGQPKSEMSGGAIFPAPEAASPIPSPASEAASSTPSPTPPQ